MNRRWIRTKVIRVEIMRVQTKAEGSVRRKTRKGERSGKGQRYQVKGKRDQRK